MIRKLFLLLVSICLTGGANLLVEAIKGKVVSCPAWTLNKHKELRLFLKGDTRKGIDGEINDYANVSIDWIRGKKAILTILDDDGKVIEDVSLYTLKTRAEMHKLMVDKGFAKKSRGQKVAEMQAKAVETELKQLDSLDIYVKMSSVYLFLFGTTAVGVIYLCFVMRRKKSFRRNTRGTELMRL